MPATEGVTSFQLVVLDKLLGPTEYRRWRIRKVEQISPLNTTSYRSKLSFQFLIPEELLRDALRTYRDESNGGELGLRALGIAPLDQPLNEAVETPGPTLNPVDLVIPVAMMPKRSLVGFSMWGPDGKTVPLISRKVGSSITRELIARRLRQKHLGDFYEATKDLILAFCNIAGDDLRQIAEEYRLNLEQCAVEDSYASFGRKFLKTALGSRNVPFATIEQDWIRAEPILFGFALGIRRWLRGHYPHLQDMHAFMNPVVNPIIAVPDYIRLRLASDRLFDQKTDAEKTEIIRAMFIECLTVLLVYHQTLSEINDQALYTWVFDLLDWFAHNYLMMTKVPVITNEEFVVKFEQILPAYEGWGEGLAGYLIRKVESLALSGLQFFPVALADASSTHFEISCEAQDLVQDHKANTLWVGSAPVQATRIFGQVSHASPNSQHLYTWISGDEVQTVATQAARKRGVQLHLHSHFTLGINAVLQVKFHAEGTYRLFIFSLIGITGFLAWANFAGYPIGGTAQDRPLVMLILPLILTLLGTIARFRTTEPILSQWIRTPSLVVVMLAFLALAAALLR